MRPPPTENEITVRVRVDKDLWRELRASALFDDEPVHQVIEAAFCRYLEARVPQRSERRTG